MPFLPKSDINRFYAHVGLFQLAASTSSAFSIAFLLRQGLMPATVFLAITAMLALRFSLRPVVLVIAPSLGLRRTLILGTFLTAAQYLVLAEVRGLDYFLLAYVLATAIGEVVYWTTFHAFFAAIGDAPQLGRQISTRQIMQAVASVVGPPIGGLMLAFMAPIAAFAVSALIRLAATAPLLGAGDPPLAREAPSRSFSGAKFGIIAFVTDGWIVNTASVAWAMIVFIALNEQFDRLGSALAAAGLVGAFAGFILGRYIDMGHGRRAVAVNLGAWTLILAAQAVVGYDPRLVVTVMLASALLGGFGLPALMAAVYAEAKMAKCSFRFQFAAEGGWDVGGGLASLACALLLSLGAPLQAVFLLAAPVLLIQAWLLDGNYAARKAALTAGE